MKKRTGIMTFRLPEEEKAKLNFFAEQGDRTLSDMAVMAVRELIEKLEAAQPKPKKK
jgi:predicted transcriptional regulator